MNKLVIDAANKNVFLTIITNSDNYNVSFENSKTNYENLVILINDFLNSKQLKINNISTLYVNRGPGSFAGIRNSLSIIKALFLTKSINYYCFSFNDFTGLKDIKYKDVPNLCEKFKIKKNLINPIYLS